jgi:RNA polymerase sigma-70 factor (ECF subfamily)
VFRQVDVAVSITDQYQAWMLAFQAGDLERFQMLVEHHREPVIHYLSRCVSNRAVAEELAQEVFLRVYLSRNYQPTAKFRTWLFHIATNLALNWLRDHRTETGTLRLDSWPRTMRNREVRVRERSVEEQLVADCRVGEVRAAIDALPGRSRAAVLMHKYEDMEYAEIAAVLHCSVSATKSLLFRAYEQLRKRLAHLDPAVTATV